MGKVIKKCATNSEVQKFTSKLRSGVNTANHSIDEIETEEKINNNDVTDFGSVENDCDNEENSISVIDLCSSEIKQEFFVSKNLSMYSKKMMTTMLRTRKNSILLIGNPGVGKDTVVKYTAKCIAQGQCSKIFSENKTAIYQISEYDMQGDSEELIENLNSIFELASSVGVKNIGIYIDNIINISKDFIGEYEYIMDNIDITLFDNFKFIIRFDDILIEDNCDIEMYKEFLVQHTIAINVIAEENPDSILEILNIEISKLEDIHQVKISKKMREILMQIYTSKYYSSDTDINYDNILNIFEAVIVTSRLNCESEVDFTTIKEYYASDFEVMSQLSSEQIKSTAIHEAGHALIAIVEPDLYTLHGISILSDAETNISGLTCVDQHENIAYSEDNIITFATMDIAGRAAEYIFSEKNIYAIYNKLYANSGAIVDLCNMNKTLRDWVMRIGIYHDIGINIYYENYDELPEKIKLKIDQYTKKLAKKALKKAIKIIKKNKLFIVKVTELLLENYTATAAEIKKIAAEENVK